jgi:hypothetical protein
MCLIIHADFLSKFRNKSKINIIKSDLGKRFYSSISNNNLLFLPAALYQNAETDKRLILKENINKSGVYR